MQPRLWQFRYKLPWRAQATTRVVATDELAQRWYFLPAASCWQQSAPALILPWLVCIRLTHKQQHCWLWLWSFGLTRTEFRRLRRITRVGTELSWR